MARMRWDKNEQARRAARYGTAPLERELTSRGTKVQKKKRRPKAKKQKFGDAPRHKRCFRVPETDDESRMASKMNYKLQEKDPASDRFLQFQSLLHHGKPSPSNGFGVLNGELITGAFNGL